MAMIILLIILIVFCALGVLWRFPSALLRLHILLWNNRSFADAPQRVWGGIENQLMIAMPLYACRRAYEYRWHYEKNY